MPRAARLAHQRVEVVERAVGGVDVAVVGDVVPPVPVGRAGDGREPHAGDAQAGQVVQLRDDAGQVADAVAVRVGVGAGVDLVEDAAVPPAAQSSGPRVRARSDWLLRLRPTVRRHHQDRARATDRAAPSKPSAAACPTSRRRARCRTGRARSTRSRCSSGSACRCRPARVVQRELRRALGDLGGSRSLDPTPMPAGAVELGAMHPADLGSTRRRTPPSIRRRREERDCPARARCRGDSSTAG